MPELSPETIFGVDEVGSQDRLLAASSDASQPTEAASRRWPAACSVQILVRGLRSHVNMLASRLSLMLRSIIPSCLVLYVFRLLLDLLASYH